MPKPTPPTDEQLRLAFRQIHRPGWPRTLDAVLRHPVYRTCLTGIARNLNRRPAAQPAPLPLFEGLDP
jgi:hypothetical protein